MSGLQEFSFGENDGGLGGRMRKFKAQEGYTYRASFLWFKGLETGALDFGTPEAPGKPKFVGGQTHFIEGVGFVYSKGPEYVKLAGEPPKARIGTIIVVWPTDKFGKLDKTRLAAGEGEIFPWFISGDKYSYLGRIHDEYPLSEHDITMTCTDTQYQKMTFISCKENVLRTLLSNPKAEEMMKKMLAEAAQIAVSLPAEIGKDMTIEQIREKMSGVSTSGGSPAGTTPAVSGGDIDGLVDGLLD